MEAYVGLVDVVIHIRAASNVVNTIKAFWVTLSISVCQ